MIAVRRESYSFQYGVVATPRRKPIAIPRNVKPVICIEKPCFSMKMMGNASKARYWSPRRNAFLGREESHAVAKDEFWGECDHFLYVTGAR
jgi:hypothetical protein